MTDASRLLRGTLPCLLALSVATAFALPANARSAVATATRASEWWLTALHVPRAWQAAPGGGKGVIVAVLSTGVDASHPDLAGDVTIGRDYCDCGRTAAGPFWGYEGTAIASLLAGHGHGQGHRHGAGGTDGITGVAPGARILAVQVTLEYNDPQNSDPAISRRLPGAIAAGIRYAVAHGATVIALPLDPGTLGPAATGDQAAAGGNPAERAAVNYALARDVVLIAPAGDDGAATGTVNYPAAYPGVVAVGATEPGGALAPFTSRRSYVALTAPGSGLTVADPSGGYSTLASTDMSAALTAGVAALIRSRFPRLTVTEVVSALETGTHPAGAHPAPGNGHGALDAAGAVAAAAVIAASHPAPARTPTAHPAAPAPTPHVRPHQVPAHPTGLGTVAGSLLRYAVIAACVLIVALLCALGFIAASRRRAETARRGQAGPRSGQGGSHARRPRAVARPQATGQPPAGAWGQRRTQGAGGAGSSAGRALGTGSPASRAPGTGSPASRALGTGTGTGLPRIVPAPVTGALGGASRARRRRKTTEKPPWEPASQPAEALPGGPPHPALPPVGRRLLPRARPALPAAAGRPPAAQHSPLAPWEESPEEFAAAPVPTDLPDWAINSGPMYVWNPNATTGPQPAIRDEAD